VIVLAIAGRPAGVPDCGVPCDVVTDLHTVYEANALGHRIGPFHAHPGVLQSAAEWASDYTGVDGLLRGPADMPLFPSMTVRYLAFFRHHMTCLGHHGSHQQAAVISRHKTL
jgi:hypothetical protein